MRQTGGTAVGATSTRSRPLSCARASASDVAMTPNCCPSSSMILTSRMRIISLMRRSLASSLALLQQQGHRTDHGRVALQRTRNAAEGYTETERMVNARAAARDSDEDRLSAVLMIAPRTR